MNCVAFSPSGKWCVTGGEDKTIYLWDTATGERLQELKKDGHVGPVTSAFDSLIPSYWTLGTWHTSLNDGSLASITGPNSGLSGSVYTEDQGNRQKQHAPQNLVTATFMARLPGQTDTHPWGVEAEASANILEQIKTVAKSFPFYSITQTPIATSTHF